MTNKKEDKTPFKTGTVKHGTPSDASSSIYTLLEKLQNVNEDFLKNSEKLTNVVDSGGSQLVFENNIKKEAILKRRAWIGIHTCLQQILLPIIVYPKFPKMSTINFRKR